MSPAGSLLMRILLLLASLLVGVVAVLGWDYHGFVTRPAIDSGESVTYRIAPGASFTQTAHDLEAKGYLDNAWYWTALAWWKHATGKLKAGEYRLEGALTPADILTRFVDGRVAHFSLTIPEGWHYQQVRRALAKHPAIMVTLKPHADIMAALGRPGMDPEGWFYPDTYRFPRGTTDLEFLRRAYHTMQKHLRREWRHREARLPLDSPYQALILASIVEKETAEPAERSRIAAVFLSRLEQGIRLQTDPTVIYGLGSRYDGNIHAADLRRDTAYNTYLHKGLPPTPIATPGTASLHAVLHPADSAALYFVAKGDGSHHFSKTYAEHKRAVARYQLHGATE